MRTRRYEGDSVTPGVVRATVYVARGPDELRSCPPQSILVVRWATPDIVLALTNALGLVAEVGGVACHAAIIAREFGLPCVVGAVGAAAPENHLASATLQASEGVLIVEVSP